MNPSARMRALCATAVAVLALPGRGAVPRRRGSAPHPTEKINPCRQRQRVPLLFSADLSMRAEAHRNGWATRQRLPDDGLRTGVRVTTGRVGVEHVAANVVGPERLLKRWRKWPAHGSHRPDAKVLRRGIAVSRRCLTPSTCQLPVLQRALATT